MKKINYKQLFKIIPEIEENFSDFILEHNVNNLSEAISKFDFTLSHKNYNLNNEFNYWLNLFVFSKDVPSINFNENYELNIKNKAAFIAQIHLYNETVFIADIDIENMLLGVLEEFEEQLNLDFILNKLSEKIDFSNFNKNPLQKYEEKYNLLDSKEKQNFLLSENSTLPNKILKIIKNNPETLSKDSIKIISDYLFSDIISISNFNEIKLNIVNTLNNQEFISNEENTSIIEGFNKIIETYENNEKQIWVKNYNFANHFLKQIIINKITIPDLILNDLNISKKNDLLSNINKIIEFQELYFMFSKDWLKDEKNAELIVNLNAKNLSRILYTEDIFKHHTENSSNDTLSKMILNINNISMLDVVKKYNLFDRQEIFNKIATTNIKVIKENTNQDKFDKLIENYLRETDIQNIPSINENLANTVKERLHTAPQDIIDKWMPAILNSNSQWDFDLIRKTSYVKIKDIIYSKLEANPSNIPSVYDKISDIDPLLYKNMINIYPNLYTNNNFKELRLDKEITIKFIQELKRKGANSPAYNSLQKIPQIMLLDFNIALQVLSFTEKTVPSLLPTQHFNNIDFIIPCLSSIKGNSNEENIILKMPPLIQKIVSKFPQNGDKGAILYAFLKKKHLSEKLTISSPPKDESNSFFKI